MAELPDVTQHNCVEPGCGKFGPYGLRHRDGYVWYCAKHKPETKGEPENAERVE